MYAGRRRVSIGKIHECVQRVLAGDKRILLALVFGSAARGQPARDIDIGIYTSQELGILELAGYAGSLEECIGHPVDLVPLQYTPPLLRLKALTEGRLVFTRDPQLPLTLLIAAVNEYHDIRFKARIVREWARKA